jgi:hypothetical protein
MEAMDTKIALGLALSASLAFALVAKAENFAGHMAVVQSSSEALAAPSEVSVEPVVALDMMPVGVIAASKSAKSGVIVSPKAGKGASAQAGGASRLHHAQHRQAKASSSEAVAQQHRPASAVSRVADTSVPASGGSKTVPVVYMIGVAF